MLYTPQVQGHAHLHDSLEAATSNPEMKQEVCVLFLPLTPSHPHTHTPSPWCKCLEELYHHYTTAGERVRVGEGG